MNEKKTDILLYIILAIAVLIFLYINVFSKWFSRHSGMRDGEFGSDGDTVCSCEGTERSIERFLEAANYKAAYLEADGDTEAQPLGEEASSVYFEEEIGDKEHKISPQGYHLLVDLDNLLMYVYKDGEPVKTYEVSGGKPNSPSPIGTWRIISKDTWGEGFGGAWLGFNVPWGQYGIHGTNEPWAVGRANASKGCIRMRNKDVRELYRIVPYSAPVTIVYDNMPFYPMRDGDRGSDVLMMERALKKLGYYHGSEDGVFGTSLRDAVMKFQKENKLYTTGVINNSTYEKILRLEKEYDEKQKQLNKEMEEERRRLEQELE
jgi:hypothetical protein